MRTEFLHFAPPMIGDDEIAEVVAALRSGWLTSGPRARRFEEEFAALVGAEAALAVNSCSAGLHAGLVAAGVRPGDAVVTSPMTYVATANAIEHAGGVPVFADVDPVTLNLDPARADDAASRAEARGHRVAAILPVHYAGHPCDLAALARVAAAHGAALVEDAAHALPSSQNGRAVGAPVAGAVSLASFSFYANKNVTTGEGGMLVGPRVVVETARAFTQQGLTGAPGTPAWRRDATVAGYKYNLGDVAAALGLAQLRRLPAFHARRAALAARYTAALRDEPVIETPVERAGASHSWHLYVVKLDTARLRAGRDAVAAAMTERRIGTSVHFRPVHLHTYYRDRHGLAPHDFPVALRAWERVLSLPIHPAMTDADADDAAAALLDVVRALRR